MQNDASEISWGNNMRYHLSRCVWEITLACCFSCKYCGSKGGKARNSELTTEECLNVADQLAELGCRRVSMIGGEVFMRSDWKEIVSALSRKNINVNIITARSRSRCRNGLRRSISIT